MRNIRNLGTINDELAIIKRPKKHFNNQKDREEFVKHYQAKLKTEMCKNWESLGRCYY